MPVKIHPSAIVHPRAELAEGVEVGPFTIIGEHVRVGRNTRIHSSVVLEGWTTLGENNEVYPGAVIGAAPQDLSYDGSRSYVVIGDGNIIREYVTIHRASDPEGMTFIGNGNLIMGYTHVAHNCRLGNQVIIANSAGLAGHVEIEDQAVLGGMCGVHQFVRIGRLGMVGGMAKVIKDVPPFTMVDGQPAWVRGLNLRGLKRRGVNREARMALQRCHRLLYRSGLNLSEAIEAIRRCVAPGPEVEHLLGWLEAPSRMGVMIRAAERGTPWSNGRALKVEAAGL